jgi:Na+/H+ antiporter NhaD/arsenite permease-like protein
MELGSQLPLWSVVPFVGILLSIALFPLLAPAFWHRHFAKVALFWSLVVAVPFLIAYRSSALHEILRVYLIDYIPFIILLGALYTCSGGILLHGAPTGRPITNVLILLVGTGLASWIGTTGASMLLIRPLLRANSGRKHRAHLVVFFIFLVSNVGGALTPLGDPPLFLGFLHGVPFFWTMRLLPHALCVTAALLAILFVIDTRLLRREALPATRPRRPLSVEGAHNLVFLAGILGAVLLSGLWHPGALRILGVPVGIEGLVRDGILVGMAILSLRTTRRQTRIDNDFTWFPMKEVAILFFAIFTTILPVIEILRAGANGALGGMLAAVRTPAHYFWAAGGLSSFLDNAPTYLTFFNSALGKFYAGMPEPAAVAGLLANKAVYLKAISAGAVFMGANSYIGNAPNFMVRSIAEASGVRMPSFFGYMLKYSIPILIPLFGLVTLLFF